MLKGHNYGICRVCGEDHGLHPKTGHNWGLCKKCGKNHGLPPFTGRHHSEETKEKQSVARKGKRPSEVTRLKIGDARRGEKNPFYGKHHSEETKEKISVANTGRHPSEESRKKNSDTKKGEWADPAKRAKKIAGLNSPEAKATHKKKMDEEKADPEKRAKRVAGYNTPEAIANSRKRGRAQWASGRMSEVNMGTGIGGRRSDLNNQYFRSTWEANVARIMNYWGIKWEYEKKRIYYNNGHSHMIDFYLPETDSYLEVYAYLDERHLEDFYAVYESGLSTQIIGPEIYRDLEEEFKDKLPFWENGRKKAKTLNT